MEGNAGDRPGRISANAGQFQNFLIRRGERPAVLVHNELRRPVQVPGAAVITQPLPELQNLLDGGGGQRFHRRAGLQKTGVVALDRFHPGLLEHDLRKPDAVRVGCTPPGKIPAVFIVPVKQRFRGRIQWKAPPLDAGKPGRCQRLSQAHSTMTDWK